MAATVTVERDVQIGQTEHLYIGTCVPGTYATGGVAVDASANARFEHCDVQSTGGYVFEFLPASQLLKAYRQKDPANAGGADIALPEVGNGVDLSAVTARFLAIGA